MQQTLDTYGSVTLDASGKGTVTLTPESIWIWNVTTMNVRTSQAPTQTPVPQCTVYLSAVDDGHIVSQTWMGNRASATGNLLIQPNQPLIFVWENGIPGTTATASLNGTMTLR